MITVFKWIKRLVLLLLLVTAVVAGMGFVNMGTAASNREKLLSQYTELQALLLAGDDQADSVSAWSVRDHIEHLLRANEGTLASIALNREPDPVEPKALLGRVVLATGYIPRGQGQAPDGTLPEGLSALELGARFLALELALRALDVEALAAEERVVANHVVFGGFSAADWLRLMVVHDEHHMKIIADIKAQASSGG
jgi:hypothetical protein